MRHLVELHGGTVRAESDGEEQGSLFTVSLPQAAAHEVAALPARDAVYAIDGTEEVSDVSAQTPDLTGLACSWL